MLARQSQITFDTIDSLLSKKTYLTEYTSQLSDLLKFMQSDEATEHYSETLGYLSLLREVGVRAARLKAKAATLYKPLFIVENDLVWTTHLFHRPVVANDGQVYELDHFVNFISKIPSYVSEPRSQLTGKKLENLDFSLILLIKRIITNGQPYLIRVEDLICPLTKKFMNNPVLASNGLLYERAAIESELAKEPRLDEFKKLNTNLLSVEWVNKKRAELIALNRQLAPVVVEAKSTHTAVLGKLVEKTSSVKKPVISSRKRVADDAPKRPFLKKGTGSSGKFIVQPTPTVANPVPSTTNNKDKPVHFSRRR